MCSTSGRRGRLTLRSRTSAKAPSPPVCWPTSSSCRSTSSTSRSKTSRTSRSRRRSSTEEWCTPATPAMRGHRARSDREDSLCAKLGDLVFVEASLAEHGSGVLAVAGSESVLAGCGGGVERCRRKANDPAIGRARRRQLSGDGRHIPDLAGNQCGGQRRKNYPVRIFMKLAPDFLAYARDSITHLDCRRETTRGSAPGSTSTSLVRRLCDSSPKPLATSSRARKNSARGGSG